MFELDQFVADCRAAVAADRSHKLVHEIVIRAVSDPAGILSELGEPRRAQLQKLYHAPDLTILNVIWAPTTSILPHEHQMWAVKGDPYGRVEAVGARALCVRNAEPLSFIL